MLFYEQLVCISPTLGTRTGYASAVGEANGPEAGLAVLDGIDLDAVSAYQPYWAVRALTSCNCWGRHLRPWMLSTGRSAWPRIRQ
jgi:predicted RNA polymerase sigma factor